MVPSQFIEKPTESVGEDAEKTALFSHPDFKELSNNNLFAGYVQFIA
jgi:hypothetical protein